jgi:hypothetical protein
VALDLGVAKGRWGSERKATGEPEWMRLVEDTKRARLTSFVTSAFKLGSSRLGDCFN